MDLRKYDAVFAREASNQYIPKKINAFVSEVIDAIINASQAGLFHTEVVIPFRGVGMNTVETHFRSMGYNVKFHTYGDGTYTITVDW